MEAQKTHRRLMMGLITFPASSGLHNYFAIRAVSTSGFRDCYHNHCPGSVSEGHRGRKDEKYIRRLEAWRGRTCADETNACHIRFSRSQTSRMRHQARPPPLHPAIPHFGRGSHAANSLASTKSGQAPASPLLTARFDPELTPSLDHRRPACHPLSMSLFS